MSDQTIYRRARSKINWLLEHRREFCHVFILAILIIGSAPSYSRAQPLAQGRSKFVGNIATSGGSIPSNFTNYWNQITPGDDGKWGSVENTQGNFNWKNLDAIYNFALAHNMPFKEHNLVWGSQQPGWITTLDSADQRAAVKAWIDSVGHRYPMMAFVDVVNEPFNSPPPYRQALGGSGKTGWDWVVTAFTWAREACAPGVKLLINEYNVLQSNSVTNNYIALIDTLRARNLIDGIGIQGHYFEFKGAAYLGSSYTYPISTLKSNLDRISSSTGLPIYISEFDIDEQDDNLQLQNYKTYFPLFYEDPGVKGMTLWGYIQNETWKPYAYLLTDRLAERPAMKWLRSYFADYLKVNIVSPSDSAVRNPLLVWNKSVAAASYYIQVSTDSAFADVAADTTVTDTTVRLSPLSANKLFYWRVIAMNATDTGVYSAGSFVTGTEITAVNNTPRVPSGFGLSQNYPNPFNPTTNIEYRIAEKGFVSLKVYDMLGREVRTLVSGIRSAGDYTIRFNASGLPSGVYVYRLSVSPLQAHESVFTAVRKLVFVK